ncbi:hypothetical protein KP13_02660 (plasmid) [Klebsiella pneumoniae subsp. pneumoniae Kp13]|nr:hypothetical protein KP13_02660 [Klebsiella pneumoniae subsp. pneumoniae Kp13]
MYPDMQWGFWLKTINCLLNKIYFPACWIVRIFCLSGTETGGVQPGNRICIRARTACIYTYNLYL